MFAVSLPYLCCMFVVQLAGVLYVTVALGELILILLTQFLLKVYM